MNYKEYRELKDKILKLEIRESNFYNFMYTLSGLNLSGTILKEEYSYLLMDDKYYNWAGNVICLPLDIFCDSDLLANDTKWINCKDEMPEKHVSRDKNQSYTLPWNHPKKKGCFGLHCIITDGKNVTYTDYQYEDERWGYASDEFLEKHPEEYSLTYNTTHWRYFGKTNSKKALLIPKPEIFDFADDCNPYEFRK